MPELHQTNLRRKIVTQHESADVSEEGGEGVARGAGRSQGPGLKGGGKGVLEVSSVQGQT